LSYATTIEQVILAMSRAGSKDAVALLSLADRAIEIYAAHRKAHAVTRCLSLLNLVLPEQVLADLDIGSLERFLATRQQLTDRQACAKIDIEIMELVAKGGWGLNENQSTKLAQQLEAEVRTLAEQYSLEHLIGRSEAASARVIKSLM